ncbi:hypothetical protein HK096_006756, partial [Nowakowskiella sp. JEL0078]
CCRCKRILSLANYVSENGLIFCQFHKPKAAIDIPSSSTTTSSPSDSLGRNRANRILLYTNQYFRHEVPLESNIQQIDLGLDVTVSDLENDNSKNRKKTGGFQYHEEPPKLTEPNITTGIVSQRIQAFTFNNQAVRSEQKLELDNHRDVNNKKERERRDKRSDQRRLTSPNTSILVNLDTNEVQNMKRVLLSESDTPTQQVKIISRECKEEKSEEIEFKKDEAKQKTNAEKGKIDTEIFFGQSNLDSKLEPIDDASETSVILSISSCPSATVDCVSANQFLNRRVSFNSFPLSNRSASQDMLAASNFCDSNLISSLDDSYTSAELSLVTTRQQILKNISSLDSQMDSFDEFNLDHITCYQNEDFDLSASLSTVGSNQNLEETENKSSISNSLSFPEYIATASLFSKNFNTLSNEQSTLDYDNIIIPNDKFTEGSRPQVVSRSKSLNSNIENMHSILSRKHIKSVSSLISENIHDNDILETISDRSPAYLQSLYESIIQNGTELSKLYETFANAPASGLRSKYPVDTIMMLLRSVLNTAKMIILIAGSVMSLHDLRIATRNLRRMEPEIVMEAESMRINPELSKMSKGETLNVLGSCKHIVSSRINQKEKEEK